MGYGWRLSDGCWLVPRRPWPASLARSKLKEEIVGFRLEKRFITG